MRMYDIIAKKRDNKILTKEEIQYFVEGYTKGEIPDYQVSALLMAVYFNGMNEEETKELTLAMAKSGDMLDLSGIKGIKSDKHSTGGVGDKTSLILGPMVAAAGGCVAKMSGRGLGHTGGTIDKLESFPGFVTGISEEEFFNNVNSIGISIAGQTGNLAPADKKMYALRDVTATVENISLIAASIMSKKLASGADVIVLDVKSGNGAFMKNEKDAIALAEEMVAIGNNVNKNTMAVVSDMNVPLGYAIGNTLEVIEAIETLKGNGPDDLMELCLVLGSYMLLGSRVADSMEEAENMLREVISNGRALEKFAMLIKAQHGDAGAVYDTSLLPKASIQKQFLSTANGYVSEMICEDIGKAAMLLGGGRETKEDDIDLSVGIILKKKTGDYVKEGESLAILYANDDKRLKNAESVLAKAIKITKDKPVKQKLIKCLVTKEGVTYLD